MLSRFSVLLQSKLFFLDIPATDVELCFRVTGMLLTQYICSISRTRQTCRTGNLCVRIAGLLLSEMVYKDNCDLVFIRYGYCNNYSHSNTLEISEKLLFI